MLWCLLGLKGVFPGSPGLRTSPRVKPGDWYLGSCQKHLCLVLTMSDRRFSLSVSFRLDTGIRRPSWSVSFTKAFVALANIWEMVVDRFSSCSRWQRHKWQRHLRNKTRMTTSTLNTYNSFWIAFKYISHTWKMARQSIQTQDSLSLGKEWIRTE